MIHEMRQMCLTETAQQRSVGPTGSLIAVSNGRSRYAIPPGFISLQRGCCALSLAAIVLMTGCGTAPKTKADAGLLEQLPAPSPRQSAPAAAPDQPPPVPAPETTPPERPELSSIPTLVQPSQLPYEERNEPETTVSASVPSPPAAPPKLISLHFEDADLLVVLRVLGDAAGINFLVGQGVKSQVTMKVDKLPVTEAWPIFQALLNANDLTAVKEGSIYKILSSTAAQKQPGPITFGREVQSGEGFFTQIVPLQYLSATGISKVFEPLNSQGRVIAHQETNTLILSGPAEMIREIVQTIKTLDVPGRKKDVPEVFVYYVSNAKASELAGVLQAVFTKKGQSGGLARPVLASLESGRSVPIPPMPGVAPQRPDEDVGHLAPGQSDEGRVVGEVRIIPDERTNALIVKATPHDYEIVKETIQKLDLMPRQVIIEVLVAEVSLTDSFNLGIEWFIKTGMFTFAQAFGLGAGSGFTATFVDSNDVRAFLTTLSSRTKINIVTSPHLLARDNKAARIQIGQEVPIVTGSQSTTTGIAVGGENVFQTIQQRDIGRILNITPHVTEKRQVTLDINLEISDTLPTSTVKGTPSFSKRSITSSVVVEDLQTLMIGGIIDKSTSHAISGIPWLRDIPYLGFIFGTTADSNSRSELLILLTPHVIATPNEGFAETQRFKERLDMLQEDVRAGFSTSPSPHK